MWNEEKLDHLLTTPSARLIADIEKLAGDIMVLGAGGKMGADAVFAGEKRVPRGGRTKTGDCRVAFWRCLCCRAAPRA